MPLGDWQFWVVTISGLAAGWILLRQFLPRRGGSGRPGGAGSGKRVSLTVERKKV
jgi:hypothetical protein